MPFECLSHNELITNFLVDVGQGDFIDYEVAGIFSGRFDQPIQFALRHLKTGRVLLVDYHRDGTIHLPDGTPDWMFAA